MHSAPALSYPVARSRWQGWLVSLIGVGGTLTGLLWQYVAEPADWRQVLFAVTLLGVYSYAFWSWLRSPGGDLCWDGSDWRWLSAGRSTPGLVVAHLDFQLFLLLSLQPERGARIWLWLEPGSDAPAWLALRRAVFSRRRSRPSSARHGDRQGVAR